MATTNLINYKNVINVFIALESSGAEARFVGGCVRDSLINKPIRDIDIATPLAPEQVILALQKHNIQFVPTGIEYGTVTAIIDHIPYEITTLRKDISTDGRRAVVEYTDNWLHDAERRDFTINAMSCSKEGKIFDYFGGYRDLQMGIVRFVGEPGSRIKEDYLRILRFFRFHSYYSNNHIDMSSLLACSLHKDGINILSGERIQHEMFKLLSSSNYINTLKLMDQYDILPLIIPNLSIDNKFLEEYHRIENLINIQITALRRLAALCYNQPGALVGVINKWKLSNKNKDYLNNLAKVKTDQLISPKNLKHSIRTYGKELALALLLLNLANNKTDSKEQLLPEMLKIIETWSSPIFPIGGNDLLNIGLSGSDIGKYLSLAEDYWEEKNYSPSKDELLRFIQQHI